MWNICILHATKGKIGFKLQKLKIKLLFGMFTKVTWINYFVFIDEDFSVESRVVSTKKSNWNWGFVDFGKFNIISISKLFDMGGNEDA